MQSPFPAAPFTMAPTVWTDSDTCMWRVVRSA